MSDMKISDEDRKIIDRAIELIEPIAEQTEVSNGLHYFTDKDGDEIGEEVCDSQKCVNAMLKDIRSKLPKYSRLKVNYSHNDSEHERIAICEICGKPLNEFLTWIENELDTIDSMINSKKETLDLAFDTWVILRQLPSADHRIEYHDRPDYRAMKEKRQGELNQKIVQFANKIIGFMEETNG